MCQIDYIYVNCNYQLFPAFVPTGTSFGRCADFVKVFALRARFAKVQVL